MSQWSRSNEDWLANVMSSSLESSTNFSPTKILSKILNCRLLSKRPKSRFMLSKWSPLLWIFSGLINWDSFKFHNTSVFSRSRYPRFWVFEGCDLGQGFVIRGLIDNTNFNFITLYIIKGIWGFDYSWAVIWYQVLLSANFSIKFWIS